MSQTDKGCSTNTHSGELDLSSDAVVSIAGPAELQSPTSDSQPYLGLSQREMNWAAAAHASVVLTVLLGVATGGVGALLGIAIPAVIWYAHRLRPDYVGEQARQATYFQAAGGLALLVLILGGAFLITAGWLVTAVLSIVLVGLVLIPLMLVITILWVIALVALPIGEMVYGCYAAVEAHQGRPFRYRWMPELTAHLSRRRTQA